MKKHFAILSLCILISFGTNAQNYYQLETDLLDPTTAKGGSLFLTYGFKKNAISIGGAINQLPEMLNDQSDDFNEKRNFQFTLEYQRFFKEGAKGFYVGANTNYSNITIEELSTNAKADLDVFRVGAVIGYVWMPWKGLVINPFVNPRASFGFDDTKFTSGKTYEGEAFAPFGGLKVGWRIK